MVEAQYLKFWMGWIMVLHAVWFRFVPRWLNQGCASLCMLFRYGVSLTFVKGSVRLGSCVGHWLIQRARSASMERWRHKSPPEAKCNHSEHFTGGARGSAKHLRSNFRGCTNLINEGFGERLVRYLLSMKAAVRG